MKPKVVYKIAYHSSDKTVDLRYSQRKQVCHNVANVSLNGEKFLSKCFFDIVDIHIK